MARRRSPDPVRSILDGPYLPSPPLNSFITARALVKALEDRRRFHAFGALRPAAAVHRISRRLVISPPRKLAGLYPESRLSFALPKEVSLCVRRKERREVIHALGKRGKGAKSRKRKRNRFSDVRC